MVYPYAKTWPATARGLGHAFIKHVGVNTGSYRMGEFIATRLVKLLIEVDSRVKGARVGVLGLTFKENVSDLRHSRVPDIVETLRRFGIGSMEHDAHASANESAAEYGIDPQPLDRLTDLDALVLAVPHRAYLDDGPEWMIDRIRTGAVLIDVKSVVAPDAVPERVRLWAL